MDPDTVQVALGAHELKLYLADTPRDWTRGLIDRDLDSVDGMCFAFGHEVRLAFHMDGMTVPILIAFFDRDGAFVDATWLDVGAEPYRPSRYYKYVLELVGEHASDIGVFALLPALTAGIAPP